ncbi:MAG: hypothetical protein JXI43_04740 [Tissierellales bacterium]|nr:hypothetical protein [Tissierellales bacterium]
MKSNTDHNSVNIKEIELAKEEAKLYKKLIQQSNIPGSWLKNNLADTMMILFIMLQKRDAIPEIRMKVFTDPEFSELRNLSPKQVFEKNGQYGSDLLRHPDFLKYLTYFIFGPDLPKEFISGFCDSVEMDQMFGPEVSEDFLKMLRKSVRQFNLSKHQRTTEVFRLALEIGFNKEDSMIIRKHAMNA